VGADQGSGGTREGRCLMGVAAGRCVYMISELRRCILTDYLF
jgi:hypothetical protein